MKVTGVDAKKNTYLGRASFHLSGNKVSGTLQAPPSFPGLQLGGVRIVAKMLNTDIVVSTISAADGSFALPAMPNGNLSYTSQTFQNDRFYYGAGTMALTGPATLSIPLLSAVDDAGVEMASLAATGTAPPAKKGQLVTRRKQDLGKEPVWPSLDNAGKGSALVAATSASVSATAGAKDFPVTSSATLAVPKGTRKVTLTYNVATAEYPYYVTQQSIYNDVWSLKLYGGPQGMQLFSITRQINTQLTQAPVWQANGSTGVIEHAFDVTALAASADIELTLTAVAKNIGDSALATVVNAKVEADSKLTINSVNTAPTGWTAYNDKSYFSIPASGELNAFRRRMKLDITKPGDATIENMKVELIGAGGDALVLDEGLGTNVQLLNPKTVQTIVSFKTMASPVNGVPPPTSSIQYRYTLEATTASGEQLSDAKTDIKKHPLWRMPTGFSRYSTRDAGGDDWCSRRTYEWMLQNATLLTAINDISGEHGKNIGHDTHAKGSDIDMYHFYRFPGADATNGTSNYLQLVARVGDLPKTNSTVPAQKAIGTAAAAQIVEWINASRAGIDALAQNAHVLQIGYIRGGPDSGAIAGTNWGEVLLKTGKVTVGGVVFNLQTGSWNNAKYQPWEMHHHHIHVTLDTAD